MPKSVAIVYNKVSENPTLDEIDVLAQVKVVDRGLLALGYKTTTVPFDLDFCDTLEKLKKMQPDFIFNLVETLENNGELIAIAPALFDHLKIPYSGCSKEAIFLTSNKVITKKMMQANGIRTSEWVTVDDEGDNIFVSGEKYILKAVWEDASIGLEAENVILPTSKDDLIAKIKAKNKEKNMQFFAERYLHGRDLAIPILAGKLLPTREMQFIDFPEDKIKVFGYKSKWEKETDEYDKTEITFEFKEEDRELLTEVAQMAQMCWDRFKLNGYARIDFRTDKDGKPYVLEINPNPCIAEETAFDYAMQEIGLTLDDAVKAIVGDIRNLYK